MSARVTADIFQSHAKGRTQPFREGVQLPDPMHAIPAATILPTGRPDVSCVYETEGRLYRDLQSGRPAAIVGPDNARGRKSREITPLTAEKLRFTRTAALGECRDRHTHTQTHTHTHTHTQTPHSRNANATSWEKTLAETVARIFI